MFGAWQAVRFQGLAQAGKLKRSLDHYLAELRPRKEQTVEEMVEALKALKAAGAPMTIRMVDHPQVD